jgi:hypothetical protein
MGLPPHIPYVGVCGGVKVHGVPTGSSSRGQTTFLTATGALYSVITLYN